MVHGACDVCGCSIEECECRPEQSVDFEIEVFLPDGTGLYFDVCVVNCELPTKLREGSIRYMVFNTEEMGGEMLTDQQLDVLYCLWRQQRAEDIDHHILTRWSNVLHETDETFGYPYDLDA